MGRVTLTLPRLGETMEDARVTAWQVAEGQDYRRGDVLLEAETDKTLVEVPAMADGRLVRRLVAKGATVALGAPIAEVEEAAGQALPGAGTVPEPETATAPGSVAVPASAGGGLRASPAARAAARREGVVLASVAGTCRRGRVTAADVADHAGPGGRAATVVLLHGLFDSAMGWRGLPQRLSRMGLAVHAPDLPGHGDSDADAGSLDGMTEHIRAGLPEGPLSLVGHSLGAVLAVRLARRLGARVTRLVLIAPAGIGARINADFLDGMLAAETPAALARALALLDTLPPGDTLLATELARLSQRRAYLAALVHALAHQGMQQLDLIPDLETMAAPVSVIWGTGDRILDWRNVALLPSHVAIHLVRGAGHLPHLAAPGLLPALLAAPGSAAERRSAP